MLQKVEAIPGVKSAAFASYLPLSGVDNSWAFFIAGRAPNPPGVFDTSNYRPVTATYFETMEILLLRGAGFLTGGHCEWSAGDDYQRHYGAHLVVWSKSSWPTHPIWR